MGIVLLTTVGLLVVACGGLPSFALLVRAMTVVLLSQIAVGALNDYVDRHTDARTQPDKPIPAGLVPPAGALILGVAATLALPVAAAGFGPLSMAIAGLGTASGIAYDLWLKRTPLSFLAYVVAFLCLVTWVWLIAARLTPIFFAIYPPGACLLTAVHLANAFPDIEADQALGQRGLAPLLGAQRALTVIVSLYGLVATAVIVLGVATKSFATLVLAFTATLTILAAGIIGFAALDRRNARKVVFRLIAPAGGVLALAALIAVARLA